MSLKEALTGAERVGRPGRRIGLGAVCRVGSSISCGRNRDALYTRARRNCDVCVVSLSILARFLRSVDGTAPALWLRVAAPSTTYEPRCPAQTVLYQIVRDHFETFRAQAARLRDGEGLPRFTPHVA